MLATRVPSKSDQRLILCRSAIPAPNLCYPSHSNGWAARLCRQNAGLELGFQERTSVYSSHDAHQGRIRCPMSLVTDLRPVDAMAAKTAGQHLARAVR